MSEMPQIPPRPTRTQEKPGTTSTGGNALGPDMPKIPPRPAQRRIDRSQSPHRESFARSPFNEVPPNLEKKNKPSSLYNSGSGNPSSSDLPQRPSSVVLPSIGQEGSEYAEAFEAPDSTDALQPQTRSVANDLKLHAPKPSLPQSSAKQRVSTVTRTDSDQAAALGYGKTGLDRENPSNQSLKSKSSLTSLNSSHEHEYRPSSSQGPHDESIPEIGLRVPMYRDAGDVQAPSPNPSAATYAPGVGFHNDGSQKPRHHGRRSSGKGFEAPPGSYGLHGHGVIPHDRFEKEYYEKHPELLQKERGQYSGVLDHRGESVLSSEDLNKMVRETASRGSGLGTSSSVNGTPSEQVGFQASEEYTSRMSSPHPPSTYHNKSHSNASQTRFDSPLRKESAPLDVQEVSKSLGRSLPSQSDQALESDFEDDGTIHVDEPHSRASKIYGGDKHLESTESLHGDITEDGNAYVEEHGYSAPILASDEVAKEPLASWDMQPAVSPKKERRGSHEQDSAMHHRSGSASSLSSRPSSRPTSIHGGIPGMRESHSTPLEDLNEYEPLFPDDENSKPSNAADRLKRPELKNRKFPSQDIWEDTPDSLQYTATVSTPQVPEENEHSPVLKELKVHENETPAQAFARRQEELAEKESKDPSSFLNPSKDSRTKFSAIPTHLAKEIRPSMTQRFPSRDIWEDTPDSLQLQTTVSGPQTPDVDPQTPLEERSNSGPDADQPEKTDANSPTGVENARPATKGASVRPQIPARPNKPKTSGSGNQGDSVPPSVPERPTQKRSIIPPAFAAKPAMPERAKPTIPARPSRLREGSQDGLTRVTSGGSAKSQGSESDQSASQITSKPKPPVPSRPIGSKIAALQGGFMSDLNKRLQLGPMGPKKEESKPAEDEEVKEKAPLSDARKGRARGPARRAPAKSPAPAVITTPLPEAVAEKLSSLGFSIPMIQWSINMKDGSLTIIPQDVKDEANKEASETLAPVETADKAEKLKDEAVPIVEKKIPASSTTEDAHSVPSEELPKEEVQGNEESPTAPTPTSPTESPVLDDASTVTVKPSPEPEESAPPSTEQEEKVAKITAEEIKSENEDDKKEVAGGPKDADEVSTKEITKDE